MNVTVIDFEGSLKYGVVEFGAVLLENGVIQSVHTALCRPEAPISPKDVLVHGLKESMLSNEPGFGQFQDLFYDFRFRGLMAAHHAPVENALLSRYWNTVPVKAVEGHLLPSRGSWGPWLDSRIIFQHFYKLGDYSLMALINTFQLSERLNDLAEIYCPEHRRKPHCALFDAFASTLLLVFTLENLGSSIEEWIRICNSRPGENGSQMNLI